MNKVSCSDFKKVIVTQQQATATVLMIPLAELWRWTRSEWRQWGQQLSYNVAEKSSWSKDMSRWPEDPLCFGRKVRFSDMCSFLHFCSHHHFSYHVTEWR